MTSPTTSEAHEHDLEVFRSPEIRDLGTLAAWLCYANFLGRIDLKRIEKDYAGVL